MKRTMVTLLFISLGCLLFGEMTATWTKLKDASDFPSPYFFSGEYMNNTLYDSVNNVYYSAWAVQDYNTKAVWKYDLNTNLFTTYPISNYVSGYSGAIAFDSANNRLILLDSQSNSTYVVSNTGGAITALGGGVNSFRMFNRNSFLNPLTNNPVIMNGYGYSAVRNDVLEYNIPSSSWITRFPNSTNQPWRRNGASITSNSDRTKVYLFSGGGKQNGSQSGGIDPGYIPWGDGFEQLRDLWELDLASWTWSPLLINDPSILSEGAICLIPDSNLFVLIGSYTNNTNSSYLGGVYTYNPNRDDGFTQVIEYGEIPPVNTVMTSGMAMYDQINSRIVFFRNDGIWAVTISDIPAPQFTDIAHNLTGLYEGPAAWGDYDSDGDLDLIITGADLSNTCRTIVYRNDGDGLFTDINANIVGVKWGSLAWGDYDNDADLDLVLTGYDGSQPYARIYKNNGDSTFSDIIAPLYACHYSTSVWGDYDNDGDLDLVLSGGDGSTALTKLYRNDSNDTFTEINAGLLNGYGSCATWGDYDNDCDLDVLLHTTQGTKVYRNDNNGTFTDINADLLFVDGPCEWGDFNNDGFLDIIITGNLPTPYATGLYCNNGDGTFTLVNSTLIGTYWGNQALGDYDNDGDLDIVLAGRNGTTPTTKYYRNDGNFVFTDASVNIPGILFAHITCADFDNDGDLDLLVRGNNGTQQITKIYRNDMGIVNTQPDTPTNLRTSILNEYTVFEWDAPTDDHTPSSGLSYNIMIGTTYEGCQILSPMSNPDGTRQIPHIGIANDCSWKIKTSVLDNHGDYYWAVQSVDGAYLGSDFALATTQYDITASVLAGDVPLTTTFSILPSQFEPDSVSWDFENDGIIDSNGLSPTHIYTEPGVYSVKLIIQYGTDIDSTLVEEMVTVTMPTNPRIVALPDTLSYGNVATNDTVTKQMSIYNWGSEDLEIYSITAANARYTITLPQGLSYPIVVPSLTSFEIAVNFSPLAVQAYNTNLVIVSNDPDNGVLIKRLEGDGYLLNANFEATPLSGDIPLQVQFIDQSQGNIISRLWDFGDGNTSTELNPAHTYMQKGIYDVTLSVQDQYTTRLLTQIDFITALAHPIIATPDSSGIDFGIVYLGDTGTHQLIIQSTGTDTVFVSSIGFYQPSSAFLVTSESIPEYILPGMQAILNINFHPYQASTYNDTLYVYNSSENKPIMKIKLRGIGEYVPPQIPLGVSIVIEGYDTVVSWEAVTQNIYNTPITVPYYFIYGSLIPNPGPTEQIFIGYSTGTSFHHAGVNLPGSYVQPPPQYFYTVTAVVWYPPREIEFVLDELIGLNKDEFLTRMLYKK